MTQEDKQLLLKDLCARLPPRLPLCDSNFNSVESIDWLNAHHFDYRRLIGRTIGRTSQLKLLKIITLIIMKELSMEDKAKTYDEVEPKFRVGDWVVNKLGHVWHIDSFDKKNYQVSNGNKYNYFPISKQDEMHLWSIRDAKAGDILVDVYENIGIFEKRYGINWHTYCYLGNDGRLFLEGGSHGSICYPATKEQRYQLEKAMSDARYTFNFEKKELKKIEQKSA